jgi:hypothetical protein
VRNGNLLRHQQKVHLRPEPTPKVKREPPKPIPDVKTRWRRAIMEAMAKLGRTCIAPTAVMVSPMLERFIEALADVAGAGLLRAHAAGDDDIMCETIAERMRWHQLSGFDPHEAMMLAFAQSRYMLRAVLVKHMDLITG